MTTRDAIELIGRGVSAIASGFGGGPAAAFVGELFRLGAGLAELGASVDELRAITPAAVLKAARAKLWAERAKAALDKTAPESRPTDPSPRVYPEDD